MFKSIGAKLFSWMRDSYNDSHIVKGSEARNVPTIERTDSIDSSQSVFFRVISAHGGTVIETRSRDRRGDSTITVYVVPEGSSLGPSLERIITAESLKL